MYYNGSKESAKMEVNMDADLYLNHIEKVLSSNFDIKKNVAIIDRKIDLYGFWTMEFGRSFLTKDKVIDKFECNEHCFVIKKDRLDKEDVEDFISYLKRGAKEVVKPHKDHKTTYITGIMICNDVMDDDIKNMIKRFKYTKNYKLSFYGWSSIKLIVVNLKKEEIYYNSIAKEFMNNLTFEKVQ